MAGGGTVETTEGSRRPICYFLSRCSGAQPLNYPLRALGKSTTDRLHLFKTQCLVRLGVSWSSPNYSGSSGTVDRPHWARSSREEFLQPAHPSPRPLSISPDLLRVHTSLRTPIPRVHTPGFLAAQPPARGPPRVPRAPAGSRETCGTCAAR